MTYKSYIESLKAEWIGKRVEFDGKAHTVVNVDYNGSLMIDLPTMFNETTAIAAWMIGMTREQVAAEYDKH